MIRSIRTYSDDYLRRHRDTHARHAEFGTHRHPYLHATLRRLAEAATADAPPSLLDYGCGKGAFLETMRRLAIFGEIVGTDPAVAAYRARPSRRFEIVTCLDVLDQLEDRFVTAVIEDVAQFTAGVAVFSVITKQSPAFVHLRPRSALIWRQVIERQMRIVSTEIRTASQWEMTMEGACPERLVLVAEPGTASRA
jgi:2-polyprenyl-3-methyl-5-hydroxy-6-metoxy-1,4-benzoquinol methylase